MVTYGMMVAGDYVNLTLRGEPYFNKPPLFFWLQALGAHSFGWSEFAVRLPSALSSTGLIVTTYAFGRLLFSPVAGFWAALVVGTCYAGLWFGPIGIIDPVMTFFMTFGLYAWARTYFQGSSPAWYVIGWMALALGAMVKTFHAFVLPISLIAIFLWLRRDGQILRERFMWVGLGLFAVLLGVYYGMLGQAFWQHFFFEENLQRLVAQVGDEQASALEAYWGKRPIHWYFYAIWFDAFPWSFILPAGLLLLWKQGVSKYHSPELWVVLWFMGYFLAFSLVPEKHERYLLPLLPAIGLAVGYVYHYCWNNDGPILVGYKVLRWMLGLLGMAFVVAVVVGPILLQKKWYVADDVIPLAIQIVLGLGGLALVYLSIRNHVRMSLLGTGALGVGLMLVVTLCIIPAIHAEGAPRTVFYENLQRLSSPQAPIRLFQNRNWRGDEDEFYWDVYHGNFQVVGENLDDLAAIDALKDEVNTHQQLVIMMTAEQYDRLILDDPEVVSQIHLEFHRSKKKIYVVAIRNRNALT